MHNFRTNNMEWLNGDHVRNSGRHGIAGMERSSGWTRTTCVACLSLGGVQWSEKKMENDVSRSWPEVQKNRIRFMRKILFLLHFFGRRTLNQLFALFMQMFIHEQRNPSGADGLTASHLLTLDCQEQQAELKWYGHLCVCVYFSFGWDPPCLNISSVSVCMPDAVRFEQGKSSTNSCWVRY